MIGLYYKRANWTYHHPRIDLPLATRLLPSGLMEMCLPDVRGTKGPWLPYLDATIHALGPRFSSGKGLVFSAAENLIFLREILQEDRDQPTLVIAIACDWRTGIWPQLKNDHLWNPNLLDINNPKLEGLPSLPPLTPETDPYLRVIRLRERGTNDETPQYIATSEQVTWDHVEEAKEIRSAYGCVDSSITLVGISPETAVQSIYQDPIQEGQSPFALAIGVTFERLLFEQNAARLVDLYQHAGRLLAPVRVINLDTLIPMASPHALVRRRLFTRLSLQRRLNRDPQAPHIIIHGRLQIIVNGIPHDIEPDLLVAADGETCYRPGEIKSFADRDGKTNYADLRSALRQAAVAVHGLRQLVLRLGVTQPQQVVPAVVDLLFKKPGSGQATLRPMTIQQECASIEAVLRQAPHDFCTLEQVLLALGPQATLDQAVVLDQIPNHFHPTCKEFCPLVSRCKREAIATSSPMLLGRQAHATLTSIGSISRTLELLNGQPACTPAEDQLAHRLQEAERELRKAIAHV